MEENNINSASNIVENSQNAKKGQQNIAGAIIVAGLIIAGAILLKGNTSSPALPSAPVASINIVPVGTTDRILGSPNAKVALVMYEDFQCPFCGRFVADAEKTIRANYVDTGKLQFVYRDFAFLGPESVQSAEAAMCAADQGQFWQYHDYLFSHQNGENKGAFSDAYLKSFAKNLGLNTSTFNQCLDSGKYAQAIADAKTEGGNAGVQGTPKGFLILNKNISSSTMKNILAAATLPGSTQSGVTFYEQKNIVSIDGALPGTMVTKIIDAALKN